MKKILLTTLLLLMYSHPYANTDHTSIKRFALITASNEGGPTRETLRYAESDALAIAKVFKEIGGVNEIDKSLLLSPSVEDFKMTLLNFNKNIKKEKDTQRIEFLFYYSGHSDEEGLMLKNGKISYSDLKSYLDNINSDVRIALLDSCQSGAFTRTKGGNHKPPFLLNDANNIKGNIILTSASEDEAAQESDSIESSFFTHYLISGLRGAADTSGDKTVTLNEAYNYAFHETLNRTQKTQAGAQHPAYNMQVAGAGDLVMTDLQTLSSSISIPASLTGRVFIHKINGPLVAEINKTVNTDINIALESGKYRIIFLDGTNVYETDTSLYDGETKTLKFEQFNVTKREKNKTRGFITDDSSSHYYSTAFRKNVDNDILSIGASFHKFKLVSNQGIAENKNPLFKGYDINYQRILGKYFAMQFSFVETKGIGVLRSFTQEILVSLIGSNMTSGKGVRLYSGLGLFHQKLHDFPEKMTPYYFDIFDWNKTTNRMSGGYIPLGIQLVNNHYFMEIEYQLREYNELNANPDTFKASLFQLNFGYAL